MALLTFAIDQSGSMDDNDPNYYRLAKQFELVGYSDYEPTNYKDPADYFKEEGDKEKFGEDSANLRYIHQNPLRHTFISLLIAKGIDIVTVADLAGHSQASTTVNMYAHSLQSKKAEAISEISDLIGF